MTDQPPPQTPPPGWYPDPVTGTGHRYWNGFAWTDDHSTGPDGTGGGVQPVGEWLGETFRLVIDRIGHLFTLIVVVSLPTGLLAAYALYYGVRDVVVVFGQDALGNQTIDRVDGFSAASFAPAGLAMLLNLLASFILAAAVSRHIVFARTDRAESWSASLRGGAGRGFRVLGVSFLVGLIVAAGVIVLVIPALILPPLLIVIIPAMIVGGCWLWSRLTLATTGAAVAPKGVGSIKSSLELTQGLTMAIFGRLLLLLLIVIVIQLIGSFLTAPFAAGFGGASGIDPTTDELRMIDIFGGNAAVFGFQQVVGAIVGGLASSLYGAAMAVLYLDLGGPLDDEFRHAETSL